MSRVSRKRAEWWTDSDTTRLVQAWSDATKASAPRAATSRAVCDGFNALLPPGSVSRSEHGLHVKTRTIFNAFDVMQLYIATHARADEDPSSDACAARVWFTMSATARRAAYEALNSKTYMHMSLSFEHYCAIASVRRVYRIAVDAPFAAIVTTSAKAQPRSIKPLDRSNSSNSSSNSGSNSSEPPVTNSVAMAATMARARQQFHVVMARLRRRDAPAPAPAPAPTESISHNSAADGASSTESDDYDEIVPRSPVQCTDHDGTMDNPTHKRRLNGATSNDGSPATKRMHVPPELLDLAAMLETQIETLERMVKQTTDAQARDRDERAAISQQLQRDRTERHALLERAHSRLGDVERQRAEWAAVRDMMQRERRGAASSQR